MEFAFIKYNKIWKQVIKIYVFVFFQDVNFSPFFVRYIFCKLKKFDQNYFL